MMRFTRSCMAVRRHSAKFTLKTNHFQMEPHWNRDSTTLPQACADELQPKNNERSGTRQKPETTWALATY